MPVRVLWLRATMSTKNETFRSLLSSISVRHDSRRVFDGFVRLAACALAMQTREAEYLAEAKRWDRDELDVFSRALGALVLEMERDSYTDLLGTHYMDFALSQSSAQRGGEFHTPQAICRLMSRLVLGDEEPTEPIQICEPCCGAGAMILSTFEAMTPRQRSFARFTAIDINATACDMCYINTTLWGIPCRVVHGNTLSGEFWGAWSNLHFLMPWPRCDAASDTDPQTVTVPELPAQGEPPSPAEVAAITRQLQTEFAF